MKKLCVAAVAAITMTSCYEEQFESRTDSENYYASVETFGTGTKTVLGEGRTAVWSSEDRIAIFEGSSTGQAYQVLDSYVGKSSGEFALVEGLATDGSGSAFEGTVAVYPFNESLAVTSGDDGGYVIEGINFPSEQKYTAGSFSDEAFPMAALSTAGSKNLSFKNIGGVLKLSLTGSYSVSQITLTGNSGELLSGSAAVTLGSDGIPSVKMSEDASGSVTLTCDPAVQLDEEKATEFYISIPPTDFEAGFKVTVTATDGTEHVKTTDRQNILVRSGIMAMPGLGANSFTSVKLAGNTVIIEEDKAKYITSIEGGRISIDPSIPAQDVPEIGNILICPVTEKTPQGFIGKVVSVQNTTGGVELSTEPAALYEAFEELHINTSIDAAPYIQSAQDSKGNELAVRQVSDNEWFAALPHTKAEGSGNLNIAVGVESEGFEGEIYQSNTFTVNIDISEFKVDRFDVSIEKKTGIKGEWELFGWESEDFRKTLGDMKIKCLPITIPGTPIVVVPILYSEFFFEKKAEVSLTAELGLVMEHQLYRFSYNSGNPVSETIDLTVGPKAYFQFNSLEAKGEMGLGLAGGVKLEFWNEDLLSLGTELTAMGSIGIDAEISMEDELLETNVKAYLSPSLTASIYAESFLFGLSGYEDGKIKKDFPLWEDDGLEIYALPRFSNVEKNTEGTELTAAADVDKLSLIWCEEKGFALFEKDGEEAIEHIPFDNPEPSFTTNRDTVTFTLPSSEVTYIAKPYVLAFGKYYYAPEDDRWVDLGLSVLWAAYNVGASSPEEYGGHYAWGETSTRSDYRWGNYKYLEYYYDDEWDCWLERGKFIGNEISGTSYDVAHVKWGGGARMPTLAEVQELVYNCTFTGGSYNGVRGNYVTGPNGNSIFLPFSGGWDIDVLYNVGNIGFFWSGTCKDGYLGRYDAYLLCCKEGYGDMESVSRYVGLSVRPVTEK